MPSPFRALRSPAAAALLLVAAVYLGTCLRLETGAFWVIDNANKFLQMQAIEASGGRDFSFYPPAFAALAALPHLALGMPGLAVLPLLGALELLSGVARAARVLGADGRGSAAAVLVTGLCTPVWFYSEIFWEHVPAAALALWGALGVLRFLRDGRPCRVPARRALPLLRRARGGGDARRPRRLRGHGRHRGCLARPRNPAALGLPGLGHRTPARLPPPLPVRAGPRRPPGRAPRRAAPGLPRERPRPRGLAPARRSRATAPFSSPRIRAPRTRERSSSASRTPTSASTRSTWCAWRSAAERDGTPERERT